MMLSETDGCSTGTDYVNPKILNRFVELFMLILMVCFLNFSNEMVFLATGARRVSTKWKMACNRAPLDPICDS